MSVHKTFRRRAECVLNVLCTLIYVQQPGRFELYSYLWMIFDCINVTNEIFKRELDVVQLDIYFPEVSNINYQLSDSMFSSCWTLEIL